MSSILDQLSDPILLNQTLDYLADTLHLSVNVVDNDGISVLSRRPNGADFPVSRSYPFRFVSDIGALVCAASDQAALAAADPHILYCLNALDSQLQREVDLRETTDEMLHLSSQLNFLHKLALKIIGIGDLSRGYQIVLDEISSAIKADQGFVRTKGRRDETICVTNRMNAEEIDAVRYEDCIRTGAPKGPIICSATDGSTILSSPVREKEGQCGRMVFVRRPDKRPFSASEKQFVSIIENIISPTFETLRLYDSLQDLYMNTVKALAAAIDAKDEYTHGHSFRVAQYALAIGRQMDIDIQQLNDLETAGYMHDLGKIGISELVLGKPGKLTPDEFMHIQKHPAFTNKILQPIKLPARILEGAIQHHERMDGKGYPCGLVGTEISLFGRIIAVADVFDALTTKRPYRDAMSVEEGLRIMCEGIGPQFDREVVMAFIEALRSNRIGEVADDSRFVLRYDGIQNFNQFLIDLAEFAMGPNQN